MGGAGNGSDSARLGIAESALYLIARCAADCVPADNGLIAAVKGNGDAGCAGSAGNGYTLGYAACTFNAVSS